MRIKRVKIRNFRCLDSVDLEFDDVTMIIGPNGTGKSTILRALEWFFHSSGKGSLTAADIFSEADPAEAVSVEVTFDGLTDADRAVIRPKYAPPGVDTLTLSRVFRDGEEKITGTASVFPPFEAVRNAGSKTDMRGAYKAMLVEQTDLEVEFPVWTNADDMLTAMDAWEFANPKHCESIEVYGTHFHGFAGKDDLLKRFFFVLVPADLRAAEEVQDTRGSLIGRILARALDRSAADAELGALAEKTRAEHEEINRKHFGSQLAAISSDLTAEVASFASGRTMTVAAEPSEVRPQPTRFRVDVEDHKTITTVDRQGHGFQRSMLLASLKLLAQTRAEDGDPGVIFLGIEEPELFQHPAQAKTFASVLRNLAEDRARGIQVGYATHSPYFVDPVHFDQIRRVSRAPLGSSPRVQIGHASQAEVVSAVDGYVPAERVERQLAKVCLGELRDALFADAVLLVEGSTDQAVYEGMASPTQLLAMAGIEVASVGGKGNFFMPHAILTLLGITVHVVFDNDRGGGRRSHPGDDAKSVRSAKDDDANARSMNHKILDYLGVQKEDWPAGQLTSEVTVLEANLEETIKTSWPDFQTTWTQLEQEREIEDKEAAAFRLAASTAPNPAPELVSVIEAVRALVP